MIIQYVTTINANMIISILTVQTACVNILEKPGVASTAANESILAPLSKQTESSYSPRDLGTLELLPMPVAWLGYFQLDYCSLNKIAFSQKNHPSLHFPGF